jgi:putative membrane protein
LTRVPLFAAAAGLSLTLLGSTPPRRVGPRLDDAVILARFADMVTVDLGCAQLAVERGHAKEVRDFAEVLVREHGMARQMARDLATQLQVTLKPPTDNRSRAEHEKVIRGLRERPDIAFDVLFLRHEAEYHKELLDLLNKEWLPGAKDADLSAMLSQVAPAFEAHARMADELAKRHPSDH